MPLRANCPPASCDALAQCRKLGELCKIRIPELHRETAFRLGAFAAIRAIMFRHGPLPVTDGSVSFPEVPVPGRLDAIDWKILAELQDDGRMTNVELARRVGISAPPCLRRVRALEEAGFIKGYRALLDEKPARLRGDGVRHGAPGEPGGGRSRRVRGSSCAGRAAGARVLDAVGRDRLHPQMRGAEPDHLPGTSWRGSPPSRTCAT